MKQSSVAKVPNFLSGESGPSDSLSKVPSSYGTAQPVHCREYAKLCQDGTECVLLIHVCDGEEECMDGSDDLDYGEF